MSKSRWGFNYQSRYSPQSLTYPAKTHGECEGMARAYVQWLAEARGWDFEKANKYAREQPMGRVLSAQHFGTDERLVKPARKPKLAIAREPKPTPLADRARAFALMLVDEFSRDKIDAQLVAQAVIGLREALKESPQ